MKPQPILLIHGGAWAIPDEALGSNKQGITAALTAGWAALSRGGSAMDAVEASITVLEDHEAFDAGRGSFLTRDGRVQLDALMMNGANLRAGGVACVERLRNPIQAARLVLEQSPHVYFVGAGAERFATQHGMRLIENAELILPRERDRLMAFQRAEAAGQPDTTFSGGATDQAAFNTDIDAEIEASLPEEFRIDDPTLHSHDTVGAVALDFHGNLAAGTSTGGTLSKAPGRGGDSRGLADRVGRTHHEARSRQVGRRPRGGGKHAAGRCR
jgi:beta-aspartyl-peptidase (threonine type)